MSNPGIIIPPRRRRLPGQRPQVSYARPKAVPKPTPPIEKGPDDKSWREMARSKAVIEKREEGSVKFL